MENNLWKVVCVVCAQLLSATGSLGQLDVCGRPPLNTKIVGGDDAPAGAWPWQASVQASGRHFCGGSLINKNWVLSAAHCFESSSITARDITIFLGMESLEGTNPNMQKKTVLKIINHENYNSTKLNNDIALVQLSSSVTFNNYVMPVCLAASNSLFLKGTKAWVTGWGNIRFGVTMPSPKTLQEVQVSVVNHSDCAKKYGSDIITENMICAAEGGKGACQGDSGGPLVVKCNGTWVQAGIVSFVKANECASAVVPDVYVRVTQYQDWINRQIDSNQPGFVTSTCSRGSPNHFLSRNLILSFSIIPFLLSLSIFQ
ncbi:chymotrypsinogen A-like [Neoarius graeffei]|uniref:chymotrypsinogen A-like n=1 Tax=Neoarius graeffei TaxID=443677 RepID=UPI00298C8BF1|nr:chymotrypsinogen A-like [Neoarius graeffei]